MKYKVVMYLIAFVIGTAGILTTLDQSPEIPAVTVVEAKTETEPEDITEPENIPVPVYILCRVVENYDELIDGIMMTVLVCQMPNGELHQYGIIDAPDGDITVVCFKTENQDDYSVYEVVACK